MLSCVKTAGGLLLFGKSSIYKLCYYCWHFGHDWSLRWNGLSNCRSPFSILMNFEIVIVYHSTYEHIQRRRWPDSKLSLVYAWFVVIFPTSEHHWPLAGEQGMKIWTILLHSLYSKVHEFTCDCAGLTSYLLHPDQSNELSILHLVQAMHAMPVIINVIT